MAGRIIEGNPADATHWEDAVATAQHITTRNNDGDTITDIEAIGTTLEQLGLAIRLGTRNDRNDHRRIIRNAVATAGAHLLQLGGEAAAIAPGKATNRAPHLPLKWAAGDTSIGMYRSAAQWLRAWWEQDTEPSGGHQA
jgi:hypothetical protein